MFLKRKKSLRNKIYIIFGASYSKNKEQQQETCQENLVRKYGIETERIHKNNVKNLR